AAARTLGFSTALPRRATAIGARIELPAAAHHALSLYGEGPSRILVSVPQHAERHFDRLMGEFAVPWRWIGRVGGPRLVIHVGDAAVIDVSVQDAFEAWRTGFERHLG